MTTPVVSFDAGTAASTPSFPYDPDRLSVRSRQIRHADRIMSDGRPRDPDLHVDDLPSDHDAATTTDSAPRIDDSHHALDENGAMFDTTLIVTPGQRRHHRRRGHSSRTLPMEAV
ncbi:MAG: hypothetical protein U0235_32590 [Polyangiaceae bacterium]